MTILVTGGTGYIGSHFALCAAKAKKDIFLMDNLSNSQLSTLNAIDEITGKNIAFSQCDLLDKKSLHQLFKDNNFSAVVHFAGLKAVSESVSNPLRYYQNNVIGSLNLLEVMQYHGVNQFVFSSSATVYGNPQFLPYTEAHPINPVNPYGQSKAMVEQFLKDLCYANPDFSALSLRYFNPIGQDESGLIYDNPKGIPNNLYPYIQRVANGQYSFLNVFGDDYQTIDGTGVRDYIHVCDLARGHLNALDYLSRHKGYKAINLGAGKGVSVLEVIKAYQTINQIEIPYQIQKRRAGDIAAFWADASLAKSLLNWQVEYGLDDMVKDATLTLEIA